MVVPIGVPARLVPCPAFEPGAGACKCGCGMQLTDDVVLAVQAFLLALERTYAQPIRFLLTSGARCPKRNAATPGSSTTSRHMQGDAVDGWIETNTGLVWKRLPSSVLAALAGKSQLFGGIGHDQYAKTSGIIHLDARPGKPVFW